MRSQQPHQNVIFQLVHDVLYYKSLHHTPSLVVEQKQQQNF